MTKNLSIKQIFAQANKAMLLFAVIPLLLSILLYSQQLLIYQQTIANIQKADAIALKVDQKVLESMWDLISGQVTVDEFNKENILEELRNDIREIKNNTNTLKEISTLDVSFVRSIHWKIIKLSSFIISWQKILWIPMNRSSIR